MKKLALYLLIALFVMPVKTQAKVWRVNNNTGVTADFNSLDAAFAALNSAISLGLDTLYLEPSATAYTPFYDLFSSPHVVCTIIGNGYFLDGSQNGNGGLQQNVLQSTIGTGGFSSIFSIGDNLTFIGIVFGASINLVPTSSYSPTTVSNLTFKSCLFNGSVQFGNIPDEEIYNCHFSKNYFLYNLKIYSNPISVLNGFSFENNILLGSFSMPHATAHDQIIIRNNVFGSIETGFGIPFICDEAYCANNIFKTSTALTFPGCILKNNIFHAPQSATSANVEANNQWAAEMSNVFQSTQTDRDKYFQLALGSQAIGAGVPNGTTAVDCGAFGGPDPYKLSGIPAIPTIYLLQMPSSIISNTNTLIDMKSRSNN